MTVGDHATPAITGGDPLAGWLAECDEPTGYLDFARIGPPLVAVRAARARALTDATRAAPGWLERLDATAVDTRHRAGALCGVPASAVALVPSTTAGLFAVAFGLPGNGTMLVPEGEFPANVVPWLRAADRGGPRVRRVPRSGDGRLVPAAVRERLDGGVVGLTVSAVDYATGHRRDLAALRALLGPERLLVVDAIQGYGVDELDLAVADVVVSGGQKWLRAGWGAAVLAVRPEAADRVSAVLGGWPGLIDPYGEHWPAETTDETGRLLMSNTDPEAVAGLGAALALASRAGLSALTSRLRAVVDEVRTLLLAAGAEVRGASWPRVERGPIVAFRMPGETPEVTQARLTAAGLTVAVRGDAVRLSPHVSTTSATLTVLSRALRYGADR
ncbi:aminotransferase class V-fold PLP-dependent enzyme [Micromonospora sp. NPDC049240]|uniref:aminotransferase class V-fold PLP-dependent enzyme n=1 Tax=Micromonospora sp. NPDC049240 TaxID=3155151 RepID=UPI0033C387B8